MAYETIGTKNGQNFFVGVPDTPASTPTGLASISQPTPTATPTATPQPGAGTTAPTQGSNPFALSQVMGALENQYKANNALMTNRNIALNALYGMPNTPEQLASLDPTLRKVLESGDKNQLEFQIRLINDQVSGRANTLDQSVQFLTNAYQQQVQQAEQQRQQAISTVLDYANSLGQRPSDIMKALYPQYASQLGSALDNLSAPMRDGKTQGTMFAVPSLEELGGAQFYKYPLSSQVYSNTGVEIDLATFKRLTGQENVPDDKVNFSGIKTLSPTSTSEGSQGGFTSQTGMRTDRHNNPIAAAVVAGGTNQYTRALDAAGIDWDYGDPFPNEPGMVTIRINGDGIEGARAILSGSNAIQGWYLNHTGKAILSQYGITTNTQFASAPESVQNAIIKGIYQAEGGNGTLVGGTAPTDIPAGAPVLPKTLTTESVRKYLVAMKNYFTDDAYWDVWGVAADALKDIGGDPSKYDKVFWDVFRPGEYDQYHD